MSGICEVWKNWPLKCGYPFDFAKNVKDRHFVVGGSKKLSTNTFFGVSFQKNVFSSFLLFSSVCYQDDLSDSERNEIASSMAHNFNNRWLLYVRFIRNKPLPKSMTDRKLKISAVFIFEIKNSKKNNIFNFLKRSFSVMLGPMDLILGVFSETYVRLLTSITSQIFFKI